MVVQSFKEKPPSSATQLRDLFRGTIISAIAPVTAVTSLNEVVHAPASCQHLSTQSEPVLQAPTQALFFLRV